MMLCYLAPTLSKRTKFIPPAKYFNDILFELRLNYYKVGIVFDTYQRMIAKWTSWSGTTPMDSQ